MMDDYIRRSDAAKLLGYTFGLDVVLRLHEVPAADVVPVVHGAWECWENEALIGVSDSGRDIWRRCRYYQCSVCGKRTVVKANYCAYCGAKMDGGNEPWKENVR